MKKKQSIKCDVDSCKYNKNSLAVYRHLGFDTVDTQEADIGGGFIMDDYIMEYRII